MSRSNTDVAVALPPTLEGALGRIVSLCLERGITLRPSSDHSREAYFRLNSARQSAIIANLESYASLLEECRFVEPRGQALSRTQELGLIDTAFRKLGMRPKHTDWQDEIRGGQVIEIYTREMVQVYRNFEFFRLCSYDLLMLLSVEWYNLYERPKAVDQSIFEQVTHVLEKEDKARRVQAPRHLLRERYLDARKVFDVESIYHVPLFDERGERAGILHNCESRVAVAGDAADRMHFV